MQRSTLLLALLALLSLPMAACEPSEPAPETPKTAENPAPAPPKTEEKKPAEPPAPVHTIEKRGKDQLDMVKVPAGPFVRGSKKGEGGEDEQPQRVITLKEFWIDKNEVTVAAFQKCVEAKACKSSTFKISKEKKTTTKKKRPVSCNYARPERSNFSMNCVNWSGASAYCKWAGKRLPTEAEWEKAARGKDGQTYPWGHEKANCTNTCMEERGLFGCGARTNCAAGSKPLGVSPYGALDMAGNLYEWVADAYGKDYYSKAPATDPFNKARAKERPVRGGSYGSDAQGVRAAQRSSFPPGERQSFVGFRCAMD